MPFYFSAARTFNYDNSYTFYRAMQLKIAATRYPDKVQI